PAAMSRFHPDIPQLGLSLFSGDVANGFAGATVRSNGASGSPSSSLAAGRRQDQIGGSDSAGDAPSGGAAARVGPVVAGRPARTMDSRTSATPAAAHQMPRPCVMVTWFSSRLDAVSWPTMRLVSP